MKHSILNLSAYDKSDRLHALKNLSVILDRFWKNITSVDDWFSAPILRAFLSHCKFKFLTRSKQTT